MCGGEGYYIMLPEPTLYIVFVKEFLLLPFCLCLVTGLFPQLDHQKRVIAKSLSRQRWPPHSTSHGKFSQLDPDRERQPPSKQRPKTSLSSSSKQQKKFSKVCQSYSKETQATSEDKPESIPSSEVPIPSSEVPTNKEWGRGSSPLVMGVSVSCCTVAKVIMIFGLWKWSLICILRTKYRL
jgi:hypothetical protein